MGGNNMRRDLVPNANPLKTRSDCAELSFFNVMMTSGGPPAHVIPMWYAILAANTWPRPDVCQSAFEFGSDSAVDEEAATDVA